MTARADLERVRLSAERAARDWLDRTEPGMSMRYAPPEPAARRRQVQSTALLLTETMAADAYAAARDAAAALGVEDTVELYQSSGQGVDTARLVLYARPIGIEFIGAYLFAHDRPGLLAVLGHEMAHAILHMTNPDYAWAFSLSQTASTPARRAVSMACEMTADRLGLLACRDVEAALRLEMHGAAGRAVAGLNLDTTAYLRQCREVAEGALARGSTMFGATHPEHYVRGYAVWLFGESDLYAEMTGRGSGARALAEVNAALAKLLGIPDGVERPPVHVPAAVRPGEPPPPPKAPKVAEPSTAIFPEEARRKLAAVVRDVGSALTKLSDHAKEQLVGSPARAEAATEAPDDELDPLEEDRRELLAKFEELERREKER